MGYYDNEPQATDAASLEQATDQLQSADAAISDDLDSDLGDGLKR